MIFNRHTIPNAVAAIRRLVRSVIRQEAFIAASDIVVLVRRERCRGCPHYAVASAQCQLCTCVISLKTLLAGERCPDSPPRWKEQTSFSSGLHP